VDLVLTKPEFAGEHPDQLQGLLPDPGKHDLVRPPDDVVGVEVEDQVRSAPSLLAHRGGMGKEVVGR